MYVMLGTRLDLALTVLIISRYASNSDNSHWQAVKRAFRYIKDIISLQMTFCGLL